MSTHPDAPTDDGHQAERTDGQPPKSEPMCPCLLVVQSTYEPIEGARILLGPEGITFGRSTPFDPELSRNASRYLLDPCVSREHLFVRPITDGHCTFRAYPNKKVWINGAADTSCEGIIGPDDILVIGQTALVYEPAVPKRFVKGETDPAARALASTLMGISLPMLELRNQITRAVRTDRAKICVLVRGETGTGKELVAQGIHKASGAKGPLVAFNSAAISDSLADSELFGIVDNYVPHVKGAPGLFLQAHRGTLFMDEVGDLSSAVQSKILRAIQERNLRHVGQQDPKSIAFDARIVSATCRDIEPDGDAGSFRQDLFSRLSGQIIRVPPLRERICDIPTLVRHFADGRKLSLADAIALMRRPWPHNVRQLKQFIEGFAPDQDQDKTSTFVIPLMAFHTAPRAASAASAPPTPGPSRRRNMPDDARQKIEEALSKTNGLVDRAASLLDVAPNNLRRDIKYYKVDRAAIRRKCMIHALTATGGEVEEAAKSLGEKPHNLAKDLERLGINPAVFRRR